MATHSTARVETAVRLLLFLLICSSVLLWIEADIPKFIASHRPTKEARRPADASRFAPAENDDTHPQNNNPFGEPAPHQGKPEPPITAAQERSLQSSSDNDMICKNLFLAGSQLQPLISSQQDTNAVFIVRTFARGIGSLSLNNVAFEVRHTYPDVRYFRMATYNLSTGYIVDELLDADMLPDPGNDNPFVDSKGHNTRQPKNYTVWIAPRPSDRALVQAMVSAASWPGSPATVANFMLFGDNPTSMGIMLRFYSPDAYYTNLTSYITFPEIRAYNLATGQQRPCPTWGAPPATFFTQSLFQKGKNVPQIPPPVNHTIGFYRSQGAFFADGVRDSGYLAAMLRLEQLPDAVLFQMRIPRYSPIPLPTHPLTDQVRYTSICSSGPLIGSRTGMCLSDAEMSQHARTEVDENGQPVQVATVLISHNVQRFAAQAAAMNASLLELYLFYKTTLLVIRQKAVNVAAFRNISLLAVPVSVSITGGSGISDLNGTIPICPVDLCEASDYMGAWAPRARYCTTAEVESGRCRF